MICSKCTYANDCVMFQFAGTGSPITACYKFKEKKQTNGDCLRAKTNEELAQEIWSCHVFASFADLLDWLKQGVEE